MVVYIVYIYVPLEIEGVPSRPLHLDRRCWRRAEGPVPRPLQTKQTEILSKTLILIL